MNTTRRIVELECLGGPMDGSFLPFYGPETVVKVLERSPFSYHYAARQEDDGSRYFVFVGVREHAA